MTFSTPSLRFGRKLLGAQSDEDLDQLAAEEARLVKIIPQLAAHLKVKAEAELADIRQRIRALTKGKGFAAE